jgi:hypothetical protein
MIRCSLRNSGLTSAAHLPDIRAGERQAGHKGCQHLWNPRADPDPHRAGKWSQIGSLTVHPSTAAHAKLKPPMNAAIPERPWVAFFLFG